VLAASGATIKKTKQEPCFFEFIISISVLASLLATFNFHILVIKGHLRSFEILDSALVGVGRTAEAATPTSSTTVTKSTTASATTSTITETTSATSTAATKAATGRAARRVPEPSATPATAASGAAAFLSSFGVVNPQFTPVERHTSQRNRLFASFGIGKFDVSKSTKCAGFTVRCEANLSHLSTVAKMSPDVVLRYTERHVADKCGGAPRCVRFDLSASTTLATSTLVLQRFNGSGRLHNVQVSVHVSDTILCNGGSSALGIGKLNVSLT
jgi:hypothetical protein